VWGDDETRRRAVRRRSWLLTSAPPRRLCSEGVGAQSEDGPSPHEIVCLTGAELDVRIHSAPARVRKLSVPSARCRNDSQGGGPGYLETHPAPRSPSDLASHNFLRYAYSSYGPEFYFLIPPATSWPPRLSGNLGIVMRSAAVAGLGLWLCPQRSRRRVSGSRNPIYGRSGLCIDARGRLADRHFSCRGF
jgi:hypothetical protein